MDEDELARLIVEARRSGAALADAPPALTLERGYAVQALVAATLGEIAGWKVGATNAGGQRFLRVAEPICGRVLAAGVIASGATAALPGDRDAEAEPEILFRLARAPDGDPVAAIGAVHLGLEVNRPSRDDALALGAGFIVADNAAHAALVVGPGIPLAALDRPEAVRVRLLLNGEPQHDGDASAVLGHPLKSLRWLAANRPLRAGDWIATGAITRACRLAIGDEVSADFGALGRVSVRR